jgi:glucuronate isomerase
VNRYNDSGIVITVHLNTQKNLRQKNMHRNQSVSLCNDSVIITTIHETYNDLMNRYNISAKLIQRLFFLNRYNDS